MICMFSFQYFIALERNEKLQPEFLDICSKEQEVGVRGVVALERRWRTWEVGAGTGGRPEQEL